MPPSTFSKCVTPSSVSNETSSRIANMAFICSCLVVLIHLRSTPIEGTFSWWFIHLTGHTIARVAVPFFFLVSGYFLASHTSNSSWYGQALAKRFKTLLIPLWLGRVLMFLWTLPIVIAANVLAKASLLRNLPTSLIEIIELFGLNPFQDCMVPYWYLRSLFLFVCLSPLIVWIVKRSRWLFICSLILMWCCYGYFGYLYRSGDVSLAANNFFVYCFSLCGFTFFSAGIGLRYYPIRIKNLNTIWIKCGAFLLTLILSIISIAYQIHSLFWLPLLVIFVYLTIPSKPFPRILTQATFPIYLLHMFLLTLLRIVEKYTSYLNTAKCSWVYFVIVAICTITLSILASCFLRRFFPRFCALFFGGR